MNGLALLFRALVVGPARRRPLRLLLPVLGVAIGVAAVAAIDRANRSVTDSFRDAAASLSGRSDFVVTGITGVALDALPRLAFLWSVGAFAPSVSGPAVVDDGSGEIVQVLGIDAGGDAAVREMRVVAPEQAQARAAFLGRDSAFVPAPFAARHGLAPGSPLRVLAGGVPRVLRVAGILELSGVARAAGGDLLVTDLFTASRLLGREGRVDRVDVVLDPGVSRESVRRRLLAALPAGLDVSPPTRSAETAELMVRAFRFNLNALGSLTLLVGMFLIANAISVSVLRRRPEIAALRTVGASRGALFAVFLAEGLAVGAAGTALGEVFGIALSRAAFRAVAGTVSSVYLPTAKLAPSGYSEAALLAAVVGLGSALLAAVVPALEATNVEPASALRTGSLESVRQSRLGARGIAAAVLSGAAVLAGRAGPIRGFPFWGFGAVVLVVAALALVAPLLVRGAARAAAAPLFRIFGAPGRLATRFFEGALARNGISVAALAMALGMTLAMIVTVASIRETVRVWVATTLRSDLWVKSAAGGSRGIVGDLPEEVVPFLASMPDVGAVDPFRARDARLPDGRPFTLASGDFRVLARLGGLPLVNGGDPRPIAAQARARGEALVSEPYARRFGASPGSVVVVPSPGGSRSFRVAGVYRDYSNDRGTVTIDRELYLRLYGDRRVTSAAVVAAPGVAPDVLRRRVLSAARGRFALSISTNRELRREVLRIFDQTFAVTHALEAIAVAVAVLGIANALVASAIERRRSFGLLKAVGAAAGQIRGAVLVEAALTGTTAAAAALAAGGAFAALLLTVINPQSFGWTVTLNVPAGRLAIAVGIVLAASVLAGVFPARLAAAVNPAEALAEE